MERRNFLKMVGYSLFGVFTKPINQEKYDSEHVGFVLTNEQGFFAYFNSFDSVRKRNVSDISDLNMIEISLPIVNHAGEIINDHREWPAGIVLQMCKLHRLVLTRQFPNRQPFSVTCLGFISSISLQEHGYSVQLLCDAQSYQVIRDKTIEEIWANFHKPKQERDVYECGIEGDFKHFPNVAGNMKDWWI